MSSLDPLSQIARDRNKTECRRPDRLAFLTEISTDRGEVAALAVGAGGALERMRLDGAGKLVAWSVASAAYLFALPFSLPDRVRPRSSRPYRLRRPLRPCAGAGRFPDGLWISDRGWA